MFISLTYVVMHLRTLISHNFSVSLSDCLRKVSWHTISNSRVNIRVIHHTIFIYMLVNDSCVIEDKDIKYTNEKDQNQYRIRVNWIKIFVYAVNFAPIL